MCTDIKENPKTFWQYVKAKNMKNNKLYQIKDPEGIVHYDDIGKANLLNEFLLQYLLLILPLRNMQL